MAGIFRYLLIACLSIGLAGCQTPVITRFAEATPATFRDHPDKAIVILATEFREITSLRVISTMGSAYFRRLDGNYDPLDRGKADFALEPSVAADWKAVFGQPDQNKIPRLFQIEPGTYVIERLKIGPEISSTPPGYMAAFNRITMGYFTVKAGDVINLGRLMVTMYWRARRFSLEVDDNTDQVREQFKDSYAQILQRMDTRLIRTENEVSFGY